MNEMKKNEFVIRLKARMCDHLQKEKYSNKVKRTNLNEEVLVNNYDL